MPEAENNPQALTTTMTRTLDALKGHYALITGGSEGLGREFAGQLAARGLHLVLVARDEIKLRAAADELQNKYAVKVVVVPADLSLAEEVRKMKATVDALGVRVRVLVNNAGCGGWGAFAERPPHTSMQIIDVNVKAPVLLAQMFFDHLRESRGYVINVASVAALQPIPYMAVYAASKSFLANFGIALWEEWRTEGIHVQTLMPGAVRTAFDEKSGGFVAPFARAPVSEVVQRSLLNLMNPRRPLVYFRGSLAQRFFARVLPTKMLVKEVAKVFRPKSAGPAKSKPRV